MKGAYSRFDVGLGDDGDAQGGNAKAMDTATPARMGLKAQYNAPDRIAGGRDRGGGGSSASAQVTRPADHAATVNPSRATVSHELLS